MNLLVLESCQRRRSASFQILEVCELLKSATAGCPVLDLAVAELHVALAVNVDAHQQPSFFITNCILKFLAHTQNHSRIDEISYGHSQHPAVILEVKCGPQSQTGPQHNAADARNEIPVTAGHHVSKLTHISNMQMQAMSRLQRAVLSQFLSLRASTRGSDSS